MDPIVLSMAPEMRILQLVADECPQDVLDAIVIILKQNKDIKGEPLKQLLDLHTYCQNKVKGD